MGYYIINYIWHFRYRNIILYTLKAQVCIGTISLMLARIHGIIRVL